MSIIAQTGELHPWKPQQKLLFRILFVYLLLQVLPLDWTFYRYLGSISWGHTTYQDIFNLAHYSTRFTAGPATFADWGILLVIAVVSGVVWTYRDANKTADYNQLWYWLRVLVRYRLALAILAYGFIKFFPLQAPYPSLSNLNTAYGAFNRWKLFSMSLGIVPGYELFLGLVEILLAVALLYRKTASIGAFLFLIFCGNVFISNIAYEGGDTVYSLQLILFAFFIFSFDFFRIVRLLLLQLPTAPNTFRPQFSNGLSVARIALKSAFVLCFIVIYGIKTGIGAKKDPYQFPGTPGLANAEGLYNVSTYVLQRDTIAYSPVDPHRWHNVVFESWNTISIKSLEPVTVDNNNAHTVITAQEPRNYESEGTNGRRYYSYTIDTAHHQLLLKNKNPHYKNEVFALTYRRPTPEQLVLQSGDSLYVVLDRLPKKYLLQEATGGGSRTRKLKL
ncbi:DoxX family protein [Chitinophaga sp. sic0106]|uniref:DoxX family protein n=1 Tax=Chitinophaga sp. sic0106 TaxID=2854785 RepID=UPI001C46081E|nr:DoxX family protein [Chitinophaga sp. sic0106]MBV7530844.1 DoxX family protein [Chitinophaga sp. sic0106]